MKEKDKNALFLLTNYHSENKTFIKRGKNILLNTFVMMQDRAVKTSFAQVLFFPN